MPSYTSIASRACDSCRRRKVKCDASQPCSSCRLSQLSCEYNFSRRKRGPKVPRRPDLPAAAENSSGFNSDGQSPQSPPVVGNLLQENLLLSRLACSSNTPTESSLSHQAELCWLIRESLIASIESALPSTRAVDVIQLCIDQYMQYTFPTAPVVHEPTLRTTCLDIFSETAAPTVFAQNEGEDEHENVTRRRSFALLTALCASVTSVMPDYLVPSRHLLTKPFFNASREMLSTFESYDLEHPNSSSLTIRMLHSTALQQMTGKSGAAWHVLGHAGLLAQNLRLFSEEAVQQHEPLESHLLRLNFWQLYAADRTAEVLRARPIVLHQTLFDGDLTLQYYGTQQIPLTDSSRTGYDPSFEEQLLQAFNFFCRVVSSAASLSSSIKNHIMSGASVEKSALSQEYIDFGGLLDELPQWLRISSLVNSSEGGLVSKQSQSSFWVQRCTILVTFHCLRLVILQQCLDSGINEGLGLGNRASVLVKKIEVIQQFVQTLEDTPFIYLEVKGEPNVSCIGMLDS